MHPIDPQQPLHITTRRYLILIISVAIVLRLTWLLLIPTQVGTGDDRWFYSHATFMVEAGDFVGETGEPTAERLVGYPLVLAGLFTVFNTTDIVVAKLFNLVMAIVGLLAIFDITRQTFRSDRIALWTVGILAIFPNHIAYTSVLLSELTFTAFLMVGISLLLRLPRTKWVWLPAGVLFGLATLIKSYFAVIPLIVWGWMFWKRQTDGQHKRFGLLMLAMLATVMPYLVRNWLVFDAFPVMSNTAGMNLWIGHHPDARGVFENPITEWMPNTPHEEYAFDQHLSRKAVDQIRSDPMHSIRLIPTKALSTFKGSVEGFDAAHYGTGDIYTGLPYALLLVVTYLLYIVLMILAIQYPLVRWRRLVHNPTLSLPAPELGGIFVLFIMGVSAVFFSDTRFAFPIRPFVFMYSAAMVVMLNDMRSAHTLNAVPTDQGHV